jgi:hypothetical protein
LPFARAPQAAWPPRRGVRIDGGRSSRNRCGGRSPTAWSPAGCPRGPCAGARRGCAARPRHSSDDSPPIGPRSAGLFGRPRLRAGRGSQALRGAWSRAPR